MKKSFPIQAVLSAIYGYLLCDIGQVYEVLNFLFDESLFTHQLPKAGRIAKPIIEKQHPFLKDIDLSGVNRDTWKGIVDNILDNNPSEIEIIQVGNYSGSMMGDLHEAMNQRQK